MPDLSLDPSTLTFSAPAPPTPVQSKANGASTQSAQKAARPANTVPRVDLEPLYTNLKGHIGEFWGEYKEAMGLFVMGECIAMETDVTNTTEADWPLALRATKSRRVLLADRPLPRRGPCY